MSAVSTRALSGDAALIGRLGRGPFQASVHSVFDRVVNVHCAEEDRLYTLACRRSDDAPCTLVVDIPSFASLGLRRGMSTASNGAKLCVGEALAIGLASAAPWSSVLPPWPSHDVPVQWALGFADREGIGGGVKPRPGRRNAVEIETGRVLRAAISALCSALSAGRMDEAYQHGSRLIGLGPGLTPAGDDFLVGLATVCAMPGGGMQECRDLLARLIDGSGPRTNPISHAAMSEAARGRVRESIVQFASAMTSGTRSTTELAARRLISIGATSGTDILLGMLAGFQLRQAMAGHGDLEAAGNGAAWSP